MENGVNTAKPKLKSAHGRTCRHPAQGDHQDGQHDHESHQHPQQVARVAGVSGLRLMPRKMSGMAMSTMTG